MNTRFERKLIELARATIDFQEQKKAYHVSFLVRGKRIESIGVNHMRKTHSLSRSYGQNIHSEVHSIIKYRGWNSNLTKCDMWNVRINRYDEVCNSRPCAPCQKIIADFGIRRTYYTDDEGEFSLFFPEKLLDAQTPRGYDRGVKQLTLTNVRG
jgi:deoxycytidylate deaminase